MQSRGNNKKIQMSKYMVYIVLAVVFVFFAITLRDNGFASTQNLLNILRQTAMISIMSVAGVFVLSAGQIDLTVGSNTAMSAMLVALVLKSTNNIFLALIVALIFGVAVGVINGLLVTRLGLPAFLATLGMMQVIRGAAMWITNTEAVPISNTVFNTIFGTGFVGPISVLILWTILFYILGYILFNRNTIWKTYSGNRWKSDGCSVFRNKSTENQDVCLYVIRSTFCFCRCSVCRTYAVRKIFLW